MSDEKLNYRLKEMKYLKHLTFGAYGREDEKKIDLKTWEMLSKKSGIVSLSLIKVEIDSDFL